MKNKGFMYAALSALLLLFTIGCQKEQSELDFSTIKNMATISGQIVYDAGVDTTSQDYMLKHIVPVKEGTPVYVEIAYSQYKPSSQGNKIFETKTDENGFYTIDVPVKTDGVSAEVRMKEFTAEKTEYDKMENGMPVFSTDIYTYKYNHSIATLKPGTVEFFKKDDQKCKEAKLSMVEYNERVTLKGQIALGYETAYLTGAYRSGSNMTVNFKVQYKEKPGTDFSFGTETDAYGRYSITIPVKSFEDGFLQIDATVEGEEVKYEHFSAPNVKNSVKGAYVAKDFLSTANFIKVIESNAYDMGTVYMKFKPGYNHNLTNNPVPTTWHDNLAGWEKYNGYTEEATITGKFLVAEEVGYKVGQFANTLRMAKFNVVYSTDPDRPNRQSKAIYVATDSVGNFSFTLPVADAQEEITVVPTYDNTIELRHYEAVDKTKYISGNYASVVQRNEEAEWNDLGTTYMQFKSTVSSFDEDLAGWKVFSHMRVAKQITAKVYIPVETGLSKGKYVPAHNVPVKVTANIGGESQDYVALVKNGELNTTIYVENASTVPSMTLTMNDFEIKNFVHYVDARKTMDVAGKYGDNVWDGKDLEDRTVWYNLGNLYANFTPTTIPTGWSTNLEGWKVSKDKKYTATITAKVFFPVEEAFGVGKFVPATEGNITLNIDGEDYVFPVVNGIITGQVLLANETDEPAITLSGTTVDDVKRFAHYTEPGKIKYLQGKYKDKLWTGKDVKDRTVWNNLGNIYFKFIPTGTVEGWDNYENLSGWFAEEGDFETEYVSGTIYWDRETGFRQAAYVGAPNRLVTVSFTDHGEKRDFTGVTNEDGTYSVAVRIKYADVQPKNITVTPDFAGKKVEYPHYRSATASEQTMIQKLEASYPATVKFSTLKKGVDKWTVRGKDYYMRALTLDGADDNTQHLAGLINIENREINGYNKTIYVKGKIMKNVQKYESSSWVAKWVPDPYRLVTVELKGSKYNGGNSVTFDTFTNSSGNYQFSINVPEDGDTDYTVTVTPKDDENDGAFVHHPDASKKDEIIVGGKYLNDNNIGAKTISLNNNDLNITDPCAKMRFKHNESKDPTGWGSYTWDADTDNL